jgi:hypothetical protein
MEVFVSENEAGYEYGAAQKSAGADCNGTIKIKSNIFLLN